LLNTDAIRVDFSHIKLAICDLPSLMWEKSRASFFFVMMPAKKTEGKKKPTPFYFE